jgi:hypothetical protein
MQMIEAPYTEQFHDCNEKQIAIERFSIGCQCKIDECRAMQQTASAKFPCLVNDTQKFSRAKLTDI